MTYGFQVTSSGGARQIDEIGKYLRVLTSGSVPLHGGYSGDFGARIPVKYLAPNQYLFAHLNKSGLYTDGWASTHPDMANDNSSITSGTFISVTQYFPETGYYNSAFDYIIATTDDWSPTESYGLRIFDSVGSIVFDSGNAMLVITNIITLTLTQSFPAGTTTYDYPLSVAPYTGGTPYFLLGPTKRVIKSATSGKYDYFEVMPSLLNSSTVRLKVTKITAAGNIWSSTLPTSLDHKLVIGVNR